MHPMLKNFNLRILNDFNVAEAFLAEAQRMLDIVRYSNQSNGMIQQQMDFHQNELDAAVAILKIRKDELERRYCRL